MITDTTTGEGLYPVGDWDEAFRDSPDARPEGALLDYDFSDPKAWSIESPRRSLADECSELVQWLSYRRHEMDQIVSEAIDERRMLLPVLTECGLDYETNPAATDVMSLINDSASVVVYHFKAVYARARPWQATACGKTVAALFPPGHVLHPGHGSYPSGHATVAHCWAELLGTLLNDPFRKKRARKAADHVARRREVAGLHFESDSTAGRALGVAIAKRILAANRLTDVQIEALLRPS